MDLGSIHVMPDIWMEIRVFVKIQKPNKTKLGASSKSKLLLILKLSGQLTKKSRSE